MSAEMRSYVISVLKGCPENCTFEDRIGNYWVSPYMFRQVIDGIESGTIQVRVLAAAASKAGSYKLHTNSISIKQSYSSAVRKASVVIHEATHCLHDLFRAQLLRPVNEIATNVAENMYRRIQLGNRGDLSDGLGAIDRAANVVARRFLSLPLDKRKLKFGDGDVDELAQVLWSSQAYMEHRATVFEGNK